jgi:hypothetical protein
MTTIHRLAEVEQIITNLDVYVAIAEEALAESERLEKLARRPKPGGEPGDMLAYDPEQKSFKNSLVAIVFAGMYLDALFYILGTKRFGKARYNKKHDNKSLEEKLSLFGLCDKATLAEAERFRKIRRELVHEKAVQISDLTVGTIHIAQEEARKALSLVKEVTENLARIAPPRKDFHET